ncbi:major facilitator superfamily multidrug-resistance, DHA1 sub-family [Lentinula aciculospora]|uniref:Major facilitator superfamily multidrug-resistance, DHA1 sub-family n=1 Tax=Lentinula aciculospora TaxID=153920 RepID=A0A9W9DIH4_9AGAR|nr:major facilitator superfamily multidrug-resistance, DHA1 sub-family [Lentinula aciculospora]
METTPLPKFQIFLTLLIQLSEPITAIVIYPFITRAVRRTGITEGDEKKTGYYAGVLESTFFLAESFTVYPIGRLSDFCGRKPILLIGPLGLSLAMLSFGLSQSFCWMVISRAAMGVFNGNIGVSKTVLAENTDATNRADAFTLMPIVWTVGSTVGPTIGGILADPATRWPHIFGKLSFFRQYPWFLSCATAGFLAFIAFVLSCWGLKEVRRFPIIISLQTLPSKTKQNRIVESSPLLTDSETSPSYGSIDDPSEQPSSISEVPPTTRALLADPKLRITLLSMAFLAFTDMSYEVLIPLIYTTSIPVGGLGLSPYQVGLILGIFGFANGVWNWMVLRKFLKKLGARKTVIVFYAFFLIHFVLLWVLRDVAAYSGRVTPLIWALLVFQLFVSTVIVTAFNAMYLLVVENAPPNALGSMNGLTQMVSSGTRGLAPIFASSIFSFSLESRIAGGHLVELVLMGITAVGIYCISRLPH